MRSPGGVGMVVGKWHAFVGVTQGFCKAYRVGESKETDGYQDSLLDLVC